MSETNNEVNEKNILMKVRQKRILQRIFNNLSLDKYLNIIRYNKHIKKKLKEILMIIKMNSSKLN